MKSSEESLIFKPRFGADGLLPAVVQDAETGEVLMLAYMNRESLAETLKRGEMVYYSRSRKQPVTPAAEAVFTARWKAAVCGFCDYCSGSRSDLKSSLSAIRISSKEMKIS